MIGLIFHGASPAALHRQSHTARLRSRRVVSAVPTTEIVKMSFDAHVVATQMALQWYLVLQGPGARCYVLSGGLQRMGRNRGALLLWAHVEGQEFSHHIVASNSTTCALKCAVTFFGTPESNAPPINAWLGTGSVVTITAAGVCSRAFPAPISLAFTVRYHNGWDLDRGYVRPRYSPVLAGKRWWLVRVARECGVYSG